MASEYKDTVSQGEVDLFTKQLNSNIRLARGQLQTAEKLYEDYDQVHKLLGDLPKQIKHKIMVPFGPLAFMPGEITHTNELTVLLGENWFADRSASQAQGIMERRQSYLQEQIDTLKADLVKLGQKVDVTKSIFGAHEHEVGEDGSKIVEIKEEFSAEPEKPSAPIETKTDIPVRQKSQEEIEADRRLLEEILKMSETDEEEGSEEEKSDDEEEEDEDEQYREGLAYSGRKDDDSDYSPVEDEEITPKKQVRFSDSVREPSTRDPDEFRSSPLWKMMQAVALQDKPEKKTPIRQVAPAELKLKKAAPQETNKPRSSIMSDVVVENEHSGPVDVEELELAIDMQVIAEEYQRKKQRQIMSQGGYSLTSEEKDLVSNQALLC
ncbi:hypothetical protein DSO57_1036749 [Entomophthora muscae]|uniref:Uncharacterized protein n=1 Tax=Entomophthora muscae TaxID=34485 RepID=A0ACC2TXB9_9FUNG|nr:hypothetical protein DSO57_1036749 [Entomophthora muscae]